VNRPLEVASGVAVFAVSVIGLMAVLKMVFYYQQSAQKIPLLSIVSLSVSGLAVLLSFVGAFILLSWANKPR
jgi:RsiW-degrading membrane proteinase PrsW (M82 family)